MTRFSSLSAMPLQTFSQTCLLLISRRLRWGRGNGSMVAVRKAAFGISVGYVSPLEYKRVSSGTVAHHNKRVFSFDRQFRSMDVV